MITAFEKKLAQTIESQMVGATPGVEVQVYLSGKKVCDLAVGKTYPYYDLASLTKVMFTTQALMAAFDEGRWTLDSKVSDFVSWFPHKQVRIVECLNHSSGLPWWYAFYQELNLKQTRQERWQAAGQIIQGMKLDPKDVSVYSDVGFMVLGFVLEGIFQKDLLQIWQDIKNRFYSRLTLDFHVDNKPIKDPEYYAPTERCQWRGKMIQGEVHDDNTWALGGVSSHAGLFGSIDDVSWCGLLLRSQITGFSKNDMRLKTAKLFASRSRGLDKGDWALGFMMPSALGSSSGKYFSPASIGHTGFTGTSLWYDPAQDLLVVILSNRVFFGRELKHFQLLRPQIHNWIIEGLRRS